MCFLTTKLDLDLDSEEDLKASSSIFKLLERSSTSTGHNSSHSKLPIVMCGLSLSDIVQ